MQFVWVWSVQPPPASQHAPKHGLTGAQVVLSPRYAPPLLAQPACDRRVHSPAASQQAPPGHEPPHGMPSPRYVPPTAMQSACVRTVQTRLTSQQAPVAMGHAADESNVAMNAATSPGSIPPLPFTSAAAQNVPPCRKQST